MPNRSFQTPDLLKKWEKSLSHSVDRLFCTQALKNATEMHFVCTGWLLTRSTILFYLQKRGLCAPKHIRFYVYMDIRSRARRTECANAHPSVQSSRKDCSAGLSPSKKSIHFLNNCDVQSGQKSSKPSFPQPKHGFNCTTSSLPQTGQQSQNSSLSRTCGSSRAPRVLGWTKDAEQCRHRYISIPLFRSLYKNKSLCFTMLL